MIHTKRPKAIVHFIMLLLLVSNSYARGKKSDGVTNSKSQYIEISKEFFNKPLLLINKITGYPNKLYHYGSAGMDVDYSVILRFELDNNNCIRIIQHQYQNYSPKDDIIKSSVHKNHFDPLICCIPIVSSTNNKIKIGADFLKRDIRLFSPVSSRAVKKYNLKLINSEPVVINNVRLKKKSIQVSRTLNFIGDKSPEKHYSKNVSVEQLLIFRVLPEEIMTPRKWDKRVGNFYLSKKRYSSDDCYIKEEVFVEKWKLEPQDTAAYFRGELTRPKNPIVFYMDENVPYKWRKYIKQGVLDWLTVFEKIGFKDAIEVHDKPKDATWDDNDPDYNMIRWVSSEIADAQGNYISDPRSGEILSGTLTWYQNFFSSANAEYFVMAAATDPAARMPVLPDTLMGKIMRKTMTHEMGHALALGHNMIASSAYPTDSLRSATFLNKYSSAASIMDYASYNFIAQPEDMPLQLIRDIGPYDYWAIEYAYKYVRPSVDNPSLEVAFTNDEMNKVFQNDHLKYMEQEYYGIVDPTSLTGDFGDDQILSGEYALKNLKRIMPNIVKWSLPESGDPAILLDRYKTLVRHVRGIFRNVSVLVGGHKSRYENSEFAIKKTEYNRDSEVMDFLSNNLFSNLEWLHNSQLEEISGKNLYSHYLERLQILTVDVLIDKKRVLRLVESDIKNNSTRTQTLLRWLSNILLKDSDTENTPLEVQKKYVYYIKELKKETSDNLILKHLLKEELDFVNKTIKLRAQKEKNPLVRGFYIELAD